MTPRQPTRPAGRAAAAPLAQGPSAAATAAPAPLPTPPTGSALAPVRRSPGPVVLDGRTLTLADVRRVARDGVPVAVPAEALQAMERARALVETVVAEGRPAYGLTTGVGVRKRHPVTAAGHDDLVLRQHLVGQGPAVPQEVVRATALLLANALARGTTAARPALLLRVVDRLNHGPLPPVRLYGSVGMADLAPLADLAVGLFDDLPLLQGEAIAVLNHSAFATGWAALAVGDALDLVDVLDRAGALDLEALAAHPDVLDPVVAQLRGYPGLATSRARIAELTAGTRMTARGLQDPLTFRNLPQVNGAARDALGFVADQVRVELNSVQANPLVLADPDGPAGAGRVISTGSCEVLPLAMALDIARLALVPALTAAAERAVKLLQAPLTGLPEGLAARSGLAECGLSEYGIAVQALVAEARLLVAPVCAELPSTTQAEGIEDRATMAPLGARRLAELVALGHRLVAVEVLLAAQACDLRRELEGGLPGQGAATLLAAVRERVPFVAEGDPLPDLEPLVGFVAGGLGERK